MLKLRNSFVLLILLLTVSCGGRVPSPHTAHDKIQSFFQKYGKKYKESDFGKHRIQRVEIVDVREVQKNFAEADAYAYLADGLTYKVRVSFLKKPFGWKYIAWENLGLADQSPVLKK